ncbi:MAG TPA: dienelactone hydrolase family protein [Thermoanaerobaculia bacterium]|nr:dienelactone hydrolase family protein [Thermoanaerobaculia bacterium]
MYATPTASVARDVEILTEAGPLHGFLTVPPGAAGIVLFAHGSGSSRFSPRNQQVAEDLQKAGLATLLFDLLTHREEEVDHFSAHLRFDVGLLARRLEAATEWTLKEPTTRDLSVGYFGASAGAAAALVAAAAYPETIKAVVSRGGRPDLAGEALSRVAAPTLLIVGGDDAPVIGLNRHAMRQMTAPVQLEIIPGATHLFEEPGTLEQVSSLAADWFGFHLGAGER